MLPALLIGAQLGASRIEGQRARRRQRAALLDQQIAEEDATRKERADRDAQIQAANAARQLAGEREVLSDQAEAEAVRQAKLSSVETTVDIAEIDPLTRQRKRRAYQEADL